MSRAILARRDGRDQWAENARWTGRRRWWTVSGRATGFASGRHFSSAAIVNAALTLEVLPQAVHGDAMDKRNWIARHKFWVLALLWLPTGVALQAAVRFLPDSNGLPGAGMWMMAAIMSAASLLVLTICGLPLALGCRRLWRAGYRRAAWWAGVAFGAMTVAASVFAGLLGPVAIAVCALVFSAPVWLACWWLARNG